MDISDSFILRIAELYGESPNYVRSFLQSVLSQLGGRELTKEERDALKKAIHEHFVTLAVKRGLVSIGLTVGISPEQTEAYFELPNEPGRKSNVELFVDQACHNICRSNN